VNLYKWDLEGGRARVPVGTDETFGTVLFTITDRNLIESDMPFSYPLFQSTQTIGKAFVEIGEGLLFPPDPVSHHLQLVYRTT